MIIPPAWEDLIKGITIDRFVVERTDSRGTR